MIERPKRESTQRFTRRRWLAAAAATGAVAVAGAAVYPAVANGPVSAELASGRSLRLLGNATLRYRMAFKGSTVGGLSGLDWDPVDDLWYAISDDDHARFYTLRIALSATGLGTPELLDVVTMKQADGRPYPTHGAGRPRFDPESIRFRPETRTLLWTSEGSQQRGIDPFVREMTLDGRHLREFRLPANFKADPTNRGGPRHNGALEGLALTPDGRGAWASMENPLFEDGPEAGVDDPGAPCRFTLFDLTSGRPVRQIAYQPEKIARVPIPGLAFADNGVSEILMIDQHRMLVLERGFSIGAGVTLRLFMIDVRDGSDTLALARLRRSAIKIAPKTLLADFDHVGLPRLDNTEGMAWGPPIASAHARAGQRPGQRTLLFVSDDNFNPLQITQFAAFAFTDPADFQPSHKA